MGKGSKRHFPKSKVKTTEDDALWEDDSEDEIDAFHKQRDLIPLDVNEGDSDDEDTEQPVFDFEGDDSDESQSDDDAEEDDVPPRGFVAKLARQAKFMEQKFGRVDDDMDEDEDQHKEEEANKKSWGGRKNIYYNADTADFEIQSSDEELPKEEEAEVLRIQREKAKSLSMADLGFEDSDEDGSDSNKQSQDGLRNDKSKRSKRDTLDASYEEIKKDIGALSKEEQMDVVFSSAPELIGLLSELNETVDRLKGIKADNAKVNGMKDGKAGLKQSEAKEALLLMYCQAISFYLLLKSEGLPVRDHPVIGRLVEIKSMLQKFNEIEERFPSQREETASTTKTAGSCKVGGSQLTEKLEKPLKLASGDRDEIKQLEDGINKKPLIDTTLENAKQKDQDVQIGAQSLEMLKMRANLEAKLKEKGLYTSGMKIKRKNFSSSQLAKGNDFDDEVQNAKSSKIKLPQVVLNKAKKIKLTSGDDDLPKRDDIGERRKKHEDRVLGRIGVNNDDDGDHDYDHDGPDDDEGASEDEFYKEAKRKHTDKLIAKQQLNAAKQIVHLMDVDEEQADGKRQITYQMKKNRGLTRHRKKDLKNPRKKYREKHDKWVKGRKGQVRGIRKQSAPYSGESSGINPFVSHSVRF